MIHHLQKEDSLDFRYSLSQGDSMDQISHLKHIILGVAVQNNEPYFLKQQQKRLQYKKLNLFEQRTQQ